MQFHFLLIMETNVNGSSLTFCLSGAFQDFYFFQNSISFVFFQFNLIITVINSLKKKINNKSFSSTRLGNNDFHIDFQINFQIDFLQM